MNRPPSLFESQEHPIQRADGVLPFNHYLWPTESWWLGHEHKHFNSRWHFGIVALKDGRFSTAGSVYSIEKNIDPVFWSLPCVFPKRETAIRVSAARLIRIMRAAKEWDDFDGGMKGEKLAFAINWTLQTVSRVTKADAPRPVFIPDPIKPKVINTTPVQGQLI